MLSLSENYDSTGIDNAGSININGHLITTDRTS